MFLCGMLYNSVNILLNFTFLNMNLILETVSVCFAFTIVKKSFFVKNKTVLNTHKMRASSCIEHYLIYY